MPVARSHREAGKAARSGCKGVNVKRQKKLTFEKKKWTHTDERDPLELLEV